MPVVIVWSYEVRSLDGLEPIRMRTVRKSSGYIRLAQWLHDHRNDKVKRGFRLREISGVSKLTAQTYKQDVTNWVAARMIQAVKASPDTKDGILLAAVLRELHELPWYEGSPERGFYFVNPAPGSYEKTYVPSGLGMQTMGKRERPAIRAHGVGIWKEPDPAEYEMWQTRLFLIQMHASTNRLATAALSGQHIGELGADALLRFAEAMHAVAVAALPPSAVGTVTPAQLRTRLPKRLPSLPAPSKPGDKSS